MQSLDKTASWPALQKHAAAIKARHLRDLFAQDEQRFDTFHLKVGNVLMDYSKQRVMRETMGMLLRLLEEQDFVKQRAALFAGEKVNASEGRPALHMALRRLEATAEILEVRQRMLDFAEKVRRRAVQGASGKPIRHVIHVGIGGSDLGPQVLVDALADGKGPALHFIHNVDGICLKQVMALCDPSATLVLLASKSFTTAETTCNAKTLRAWLAASVGDFGALQQMIALTAAPDKAAEFGIPPAHIFRFWDWVGGRFSVWSSVSLVAAMAMGQENFLAFLRGGQFMDQHFVEAPLAANMPVLLALLTLWNVNALDCPVQAVLPYCERLGLWPSYLQQLEMESLGKTVDRAGAPVNYATVPTLFGATGTCAQHAFMQALHQGSAVIPADILVLAQDGAGMPEQQRLLQSHALAQAQALALGKTAEEVRADGEIDAALIAQKTFSGNRPSTLFVLDDLRAETLGQLFALYEHKVFTLGVLWNLNPFDQWGVELGKTLAGRIETALAGSAPAAFPDSSTNALVARLKSHG